MTSTPTDVAIRARAIGQLFNSLDPSPFREKDLDAGVEEFLTGWVRELPAKAAFNIVEGERRAAEALSVLQTGNP